MRRKTKACLALPLVLVYLIVFLAHDIVYPDVPPGIFTASGNEKAAVFDPYHVDQLQWSDDHYCPFCSGFVDTHASLCDLENWIKQSQRAAPASFRLDSSAVLSHNPRAPPPQDK